MNMINFKLASKSYLALLLLVYLFGCSAPVKQRIFWPPLPRTPKVEWINTLNSEAQMPKTGGEMFVEKLTGTIPVNPLTQPVSIAADAGSQKVFVGEPVSQNIRVFDFVKREVYYFAKEALGYPQSLAVSRDGRLFVGEKTKGVILVYTLDGKALTSFGEGKLKNPASLAVDEAGQRLLVADSKEHCIKVFSLSGEYLMQFGVFGEEEGQFHTPQGVAVTAEGKVVVADTLNARIQIFDRDGNFESTFGMRGNQYYHFESPKDVAVDSEGHIWVVDFRKAALMTYTPEGQFLLFTGNKGEAVRQPFGFAGPNALWIDENDRIYVCDMLNSRFAIWQYLNEAYLGEHPLP